MLGQHDMEDEMMINMMKNDTVSMLKVRFQRFHWQRPLIELFFPIVEEILASEPL